MVGPRPYREVAGQSDRNVAARQSPVIGIVACRCVNEIASSVTQRLYLSLGRRKEWYGREIKMECGLERLRSLQLLHEVTQLLGPGIAIDWNDRMGRHDHKRLFNWTRLAKVLKAR